MTAQCLLAHAILAVPWIGGGAVVVYCVASAITIGRTDSPPVWARLGLSLLIAFLLVGGITGAVTAYDWAERVVRACQ